MITFSLFLDEGKYVLEDEAFDNKFGCNIRKTLFKKSRETLFEVSINNTEPVLENMC